MKTLYYVVKEILIVMILLLGISALVHHHCDFMVILTTPSACQPAEVPDCCPLPTPDEEQDGALPDPGLLPPGRLPPDHERSREPILPGQVWRLRLRVAPGGKVKVLEVIPNELIGDVVKYQWIGQEGGSTRGREFQSAFVLDEDVKFGSMRSDVNYMTHHSVEAAKEVDNAARWASIILAKFHNEGIDLSLGRFTVHVGFPVEQNPDDLPPLSLKKFLNDDSHPVLKTVIEAFLKDNVTTVEEFDMVELLHKILQENKETETVSPKKEEEMK